MTTLSPIRWENETLYLLDQRKLPHTEEWFEVDSIEKCHQAIKEMIVRGAPCIGFSAIFGMALELKNKIIIDKAEILRKVEFLKSARPTAVNLEYEVDRCVELIAGHDSADIAYLELVKFAQNQLELSQYRNERMAQIALEQLNTTLGKTTYRLMTHCNTGYLACGSIGTALGVISYAFAKGKLEHAYADETRPYLQGSRLTAYELSKENIPHSIVVEGAASHLLKSNRVDAIFVGADRIARNGDTANKIGTATLAIVANFYKIPFYVVAPTSSFDLNIMEGSEIKIEFRPSSEIKEFNGFKVSPEESETVNPSFDITNSSLITGIICEHGLIQAPYTENLVKVVKNENSYN
jgi:methylthioribose-1-phosphate isomerase